MTRLDGALSRHSAWLILAVLALAFALRVTGAGGPFLHGDELRIYQIAAHPDVASVYHLSAETAHPPLFFEVLHFWSRGAQSEVFLRLLSVLAGTAAVGVL